MQALTDSTPEASTERGADFQVGSRTGKARGNDIYDLTTVRASVTNPEQAGQELRSRAKKAIEGATFPHDRASHEDTQGHIERLLEMKDDAEGTIARRILQTGSPTYRRAFGKAVSGMPLSDSEQRALSLSVASGGYAIPFTLDPTIIPTSNHSVNPYRAIARVESITTTTWEGVTSAGVSAAYAAEATEASDNAPTLAQPSLTPVRAQAFIPFSYEVGQDWGALEAEMAVLIQDAKDDLEATKFTSGSGTNEPYGLITGATTTTTATGTASFAVSDVYAVEQALPPRFRARAQWVANRFAYNKVRQFDTAGGANLWVDNLSLGLANNGPTPGNIGSRLIGYEAHEVSAMDAALTTGSKIAVLGDFRHFLIAERIGMGLEIIPQVFGASGRPTGQRGLYAFWRNTSKVLVPGAFRTLVTG